MSAPVPISDNHEIGGIGAGASPAIWPKRTTRACASCRRDKIRCDGLRPCSACARKGYAADQCTDGCEPCRRARVRCEDGNGKPCKRCREMMIECADVPLAPGGCQSGQPANAAFLNVTLASTTTVTQDAGGALQRILVIDTNGVDSGGIASLKPSKPGGVNGCFSSSFSGSNAMTVGGDGPGRTTRGAERAKLACVGCRRDNKKNNYISKSCGSGLCLKCDDHRPCSRCVARSEECIHVSRGPKLVKLRCEGCREDNKRCEESRPCKYCVENLKDCIVVPRKGRGHGTRVKAACVSCRRDKIRCNGERPCASCIKKGCECVERACAACNRDGRASQCLHRKSADSPPLDNSSVSPRASIDQTIQTDDRSSATGLKEREYQSVPSQNDSRWISYGVHAPSIPPATTYPQNTVAHQEYYYHPHPGTGQTVQHQTVQQQQQLPPYSFGMQNHSHLYANHHHAYSNYFFDISDPSLENFQPSQHMMSTSSSRTFLPDD